MAAENSFVKFDYHQFNRDNFCKIISRFGKPQELRILYISTYQPDYTRTETLLEVIRQSVAGVTEVLVGDKWLKYLRAIYNLIKLQKHCDVIVVGFRGQEVLPFLKLFARKPLIFDAFLSAYDTLCFDRRTFKPESLVGKFLKWYDRFLCRLSDVVLVDTKAHKEYYELEFGVSNVDYVYVGCNEELFRPMGVERRGEKFVVFWYGYANPLQGVDVVLRAAKLLEDEEGVVFKLVGPVRKKYPKLIESLGLKNMEFVDFVAYEKLAEEINKADVCLGGHFSDRQKAGRVIAGKIFQFLACERQTILADNAANRELFEESGPVHFVKANDAQALADKILELRKMG